MNPLYREKLTELKSSLPQWETHNRLCNEKQAELAQSLQINLQSQTDILNITRSINALTTFYEAERQRTVKNLEEHITETINLWFDNKYDFEFVPETKTGPRGVKAANNNVYYRLVDKIRGGRISLVCGGGCQQTLGVLLCVTLNETIKSGMIFFDESFNSFGEKEIDRVPEVLSKTSENMQVIVVEHGHNLLPEDNSVIYTVNRTEGQSSTVTYSDKNGLLDDVIKEIMDLGINKKDVDVLIKFGIPFDKSAQAQQYMEVYRKEYGDEDIEYNQCDN